MKTFENYLALNLIKNDAETLKKLVLLHNEPVLVLGFAPYLAMLVQEAFDYFTSFFQPLEASKDSSHSFAEVRSKLKLFHNRFGKTKKQILTIDMRQDEEFRSMLRFSFTRGLNIHYNLGVFTQEQRYIIGNTQYFNFMLQDRQLSKTQLNETEIMDFSVALGSALGSIATALELIPSNALIELQQYSPKVYYQDFNTNQSFSVFPWASEGKELTLLLLHIQSAVNFVRYILMRIVPDTNTWILRAKYITSYYTHASLKKVWERFKDHDCFSNEQADILKNLIGSSTSVFNGEFRNCMAHYSLINKDNQFLINEKYLDLQKPLFGLVETWFDGIDYNKYSTCLTDNLTRQSDLLEKLIDLKLDKLKSIIN